MQTIKCPLRGDRFLRRMKSRREANDVQRLWIEYLDAQFRHKLALPQRGFTYIGLLILIALIGIALGVTGELTSTISQRDREQQLLFVGDQFALAIAAYSEHSPGAAKYPKSLEELLKDERFPNVRRYLRRIYFDPMTNSSDWGLVMGPENGIVGVYSKSQRAPLKKKGFSSEYAAFTDAKHYSDWQFLGGSLDAEPTGRQPTRSQATPPAKNGSSFSTFSTFKTPDSARPPLPED